MYASFRPLPAAFAPVVLAAAFAAAFAAPAFAQKKAGGGTTAPAGVITIDQAKAEAGGVTPGDAPGFPVTISQPGSYRLMGNLDVPAGASAIDITVDYVTLDLNGFAIVAPGACSGPSTAIVCQNMGAYGVRSPRWFAKVRNGQIKGFSNAVNLYSAAVVEDLVVNYSVTAIDLGASSQAVRNVVHTASAKAIDVSEGAVRENQIYMAAIGVITSTTGLVERNVISSVGTAIRGYAGPVGATGNVIRYAMQPFQQVVQMGPNLCDGQLCP